MIRALVVVALAVAVSGCAPRLLELRAVPPPRSCPDGAAPKIHQHPSCRDRCGYSCLPDRWKGAP